MKHGQRRNSEHDHYVAKVNSLVTAGRDDMVEEMAAQYRPGRESGREAFWSVATPGWPARAAR